MIGRLTTALVTGALLLPLLGAAACSRRTAPGRGADTGGPGPAPGDVDCYQTAGARACPPDPSDPSGQRLPTPGAVCALSECGVCGAAGGPAFRDAAGVTRPGWCICVTKSDGSGAKVYSCFGLDQWQKR